VRGARGVVWCDSGWWVCVCACVHVCPCVWQIRGTIPVLALDVRPNASRLPLNMFDPMTNQRGSVGMPDPTPDDVIMGWFLPFNQAVVELNGVLFRERDRFDCWRRALLPYELRWCSAWLGVSTTLLVLKYGPLPPPPPPPSQPPSPLPCLLRRRVWCCLPLCNAAPTIAHMNVGSMHMIAAGRSSYCAWGQVSVPCHAMHARTNLPPD
jgi:hypothetical protein